MAEDKTARFWQTFQEITSYSDEDLARFKANPTFMQMMKTPTFRTHRIVIEVIQSHGCVCGHKVGQRLVLTGNGALISAECPPIMCVGFVSQFNVTVAALFERFAAGLDPNGLCADTIGCIDVGLDCGGWGRVVARVRVEGPQDK